MNVTWCNHARGIAGALCLLVLLTACQRTPDETVIRQHIAAMARALETRDNQEFLSHVADTYTDHEGHDKRTLRQLLLVHFAQHSGIAVSVSDISLAVRNNAAEATLRARLTGSGPSTGEYRHAPYSVQLRWKKQGGDWLLYRASWERQDAN